MIRTTTAAAALAAFALTPAQAQGPAEAQNVLVVVAHPDDELFMAPAIAALARQGREVTILFATIGDQGPGVTSLAKGAALGKVRRGEAVCSAEALGANPRFIEGVGDGTLANTPQAPDSPANAFLERFTDEYLALMPGLVLTWGPDGGYGHADHRMVSALTAQALQSLDPDIRARLLHVGIPNGTLPPLPQMSNWATTDPKLLTETIAYTPADLKAATAAAGCHETQFDAFSRDGMMSMFDGTMWQGKVHFRPAF